MIKIFNSHSDCIKNLLNEISYEYRDKKYFLDVGCGDGARTILFDAFGRDICGVDRMFWLKETIKDRIDFRQEDFVNANLSYENSSFDIILSFDVIEHLLNPKIMLKEIYRLLKKDGIFIISTPNRNRLFGFFLILFRLRKFPYYPNKNTINSDPYSAHITEYTLSELENLLSQTGFRIVKRHKIFYGITGKYGFSYFFSLPFFHKIVLECGKV